MIVALAMCAIGVIAAGSTWTRTPVSVSSFSLSNTSTDVSFSPGTLGATNIRFYCAGPEAGHFQVKLPRLQGIDVGGITNVSEDTWYNVTTGDYFQTPFVARATIRTTNNINNKVSIFFD
jgi:hypothetical protein